jgi:hypothetical protein
MKHMRTEHTDDKPYEWSMVKLSNYCNTSENRKKDNTIMF